MKISHTVAYKILEHISNLRVSSVFIVPGKTIMPLMVAIEQLENRLNSIVCSTELGAGFMADGYARASGGFGVAISISGPGFNNIYGAIANAYYDHSRILVICGTTPTTLSGRNTFQDSSIYKFDCSNIASSLSSYSCNLHSTNIANHLSNSFFYLNNYNLPVVMQIPIDVQSLNCDFTIYTKLVNKEYLNYPALKTIKAMISSKELFIIITGSRAIDHTEGIRRLCHKYFLPCASTLCSKGTISENSEFYLGVFGFGMSPRVDALLNDQAIKNIITIGLDFNERNTSNWKHIKSKQVIHLDSVVSENSRDHSQCDHIFVTDLDLLFNEIETDLEINEDLFKTISLRKKLLSNLYQKIPYSIPITHSDNLLYVDQVINEINKPYSKDTNLVIDSGLHRLYCAHLYRTESPKSYFTSINNGHMGWAIAASIGIKISSPEKTCICITGDGCMLMHGTEIQTAARYNVKVLFIVLNNNAHGAVCTDKLPQESYTLPNHDWAAFAGSLGINACKVTNTQELQDALVLYEKLNAPMLLDVKCHYDTKINLNYYYQN